MTTTQVIATAAILQAASAGLVAWFTIRLTGWTRKLSDFTKDYVDEMRRSNNLIAEGNLISAGMMAVAQGQAQPRPVVNQRGRRANNDWVWAPIEVLNYGGGPAEGVVVVTDWGEGSVSGVVGSGGRGETKVGLPLHEWESRGEKNPRLERVRYRDSMGVDHDDEIA